MFLYPTTLKSVGYYVIPSIQKLAFERPFIGPSLRPSVCPSRRPSVSASFSLSAGTFFTNSFKLGMRVDIVKECSGIADGYILTNKYRVIALD